MLACSAVMCISGGVVKFMDLSIPQWIGRKFDWAMSIEVGEHLPAKFEATFMDNLARHAKRGVVLSWALEGQGGHHHVNSHNNNYVIAKLAARRLQYDEKASMQLRGQVLSLNWLKSTLMVFRRQ